MLRMMAARFFQSLAVVTWLPVPKWSCATATPCVGALPVIGVLLGVLGAAVFAASSMVLTFSLAVMLSVLAILLVTGGTAEARWAGLSARGVPALGFVLLMRVIALLELGEETVSMALMVALPLSSLVGIAALFACGAHAPGTGVVPVISHRGMVVAALFGCGPLFLLTPAELAGVAGMIVLAIGPALLLLRRLRVDALSALHITALVAEVAVYVALNLPWTFPIEETVL